MSNSRKAAMKRFKELRALKEQKVGNTTITTPNVNKTPSKSFRKTDELYMEMQERFYDMVENKMIDLSRWSGEGSPYKYAGLMD